MTTGSTAFAGFGEDAIDFYEGLAADNSREYWQRHRETYEQAVAGPMRALVAALGGETGEFGQFKIFRPFRDLRFSPDKRPYHEYARMGARPSRGGAESGGVLFLALSPDGLLLAAGYYEPSKDQLARFRRMQDDPDVCADLDATLARLAGAGYPLGAGKPVLTAPRGWSRDHPRIDLIRRTSLTVGTTQPPAEWLHSGECLDVVRDGWRIMDGWNAWLDENVRAAEHPGRLGRPRR